MAEEEGEVVEDGEGAGDAADAAEEACGEVVGGALEVGAGGLVVLKGAPFRRTTFGRKWARARTKVGLPKDFRFYDLRHTGHTLSTQSGATLKDTMVRAGQSSEKAAMIYQHSDDERQQEVAGGIDARVRAARGKASAKPKLIREA